mmetsp:Transcript_16228/g.22877  ORF Transcript_16228/g.22877 Transcript_16228/m.22877 type:complete len:404 (-) Transcript_16228:123-1334(-)
MPSQHYRHIFILVLCIVLSLTTAATTSPRSTASVPPLNKKTSKRSTKPAFGGKNLLTSIPKGGSTTAPPTTEAVVPVEPAVMTEAKAGLPDSVKLLIGAGGIYGAFLYYGSLQEDVFRYTAEDGSSFKQAWFLQVLEALANVVIGFVGMQLSGPTKGIPLTMFGISGAAQVSAKACTSLSLANGLSFPVATLAKSGKMAPVMAGSLLLGGATYTLREYLQVAAIIGGTAIVSMGKKKGGGGDNSLLGVVYIVASLVLDGVTAGFQKRLKAETAKAGVKPKPYDFMFWTNLFMCLTAIAIAGGTGEVAAGLDFCAKNPEILSKIIKFSLCSAVGQSFIFYTIANFDPLILATVTTTRKVFSVLLSIFLKGHSLSGTGWAGIGLACSGIIAEMQAKRAKSHAKAS